ncbi:MAG: single-stranded DNA-binding protein [Flavobacteriales bacterium]|nr:single-stranded DNA-binding protein [Flavobacteriales bacterium]MCB9446943.1 single-stranded DNA-binding protein [Flavobacteriales bacterium]
MNHLKNRVQLIGNLGHDPEIKVLDKGRKMAKFSVATSEVFKDESGNKVTDTQWHHVVAFGKTAEFVEKYMKKGNEVAIEGKLKYRTYEDKEGQTRYFTEVHVNELMALRSNTKQG